MAPVATGTTLPPRLAVLPLVRSRLSPELAEVVRQQIGSALDQRGYVRYDDAWVDQRLALAGLRPWEPDWLQSDERLAAFGHANGIPGFMLLEGVGADALTTGVFNSRSLSGHMRLLDVEKWQSTWAYELSSGQTGGAILQSGQIIDAIGDTLGVGERADVVRFACLLGLTLVDVLPANAVPQPIGKRPQVVAVRATPKAGPDAAVEIRVDGDPGCRAFASLPGCLGRYPLTEEEEGRYGGTLPVPAPATEVVVTLRDRFGVVSRAHRAPVEAATATEARQ